MVYTVLAIYMFLPAYDSLDLSNLILQSMLDVFSVQVVSHKGIMLLLNVSVVKRIGTEEIKKMMLKIFSVCFASGSHD